MANIRNQCSWVHSDNKSQATLKALDLVRMAVARAMLLESQVNLEVAVNQSALVIGGGAAGMTVALDIADQGYEIHLVEAENKLGGNLRKVHVPEPEFDHGVKIHPQTYLQTLVERITHHPKVKLYLDSQVTGSTGFVGNFCSQITGTDGDKTEITHGVTIIATGGKEYRGPDYGFGSHKRIITQQQFEEILSKQEPRADENTNNGLTGITSVVMIQCVGPAENYCSRICCTVALKNAIALKKINRNVSILILHKDIRSYGFKERYYEEARRLGVMFIRYEENHQPGVHIDGEKLIIRARDQVLSKDLLLNPDYVVLSMPVIPHDNSAMLGSLFKVPVDQNGFFQEVHVKLRPVDFSTAGIFMAGMAHYPKLLDESIIQAKAAAAKAVRILSNKSLVAGGQVAVVDQGKCTGCLTCIRVCPFAIPQITPDRLGVGGLPGVAFIESAVCQGCGACAAACPARAIQVMHYTDAQMMTKIKSLTHPGQYLISIDQEQVM
jgi:heterodisulfide reductase subunit A-like polyferredoxin